MNSPQSAEKETSDKKSPDGNAGMEVDDVKKLNTLKTKSLRKQTLAMKLETSQKEQGWSCNH